MSIKNLIEIDMKLHQVHMHFNIHMLTNVFFGCGVVRLNKKMRRIKKDT